MAKPEYDLSVIVPLYNEQESVIHLYKAILKILKKIDKKCEIVFVDDGSTDRTYEIVSRLSQEDTNLRLVKFRKNYGQTPAMMAGIEYARGKILVTMDGDLQNDPADIPKFLLKISEGYDLVVGWRHKRQDKLITRKIPSKIANWIIGKVTGVPIKDNGCSLKAYKADLMKNISLYSEMHRFIPAIASVAGPKIAEIKVNHHPRKYGKSKYGLSRIYRVILDLIGIKTIISLSEMPFHKFSKLSLIPSICSLPVFVLLLLRLIQNPEAPIVVLVGVVLLLLELSIFLFFTGILCDLIYKTGNLKIKELSKITANIE